MILYNITFYVDLEYVNDFKAYLNDHHISNLQQDDRVIDYTLFKLLNVDESETMTLSLQYKLKDMNAYNHHLSTTDFQLKNEVSKKYGDKVLYFCSVLEKL
ncbi:MAG: DUF4286 family protein [Chitinophagales bacterium]|nr:DUF4286 family protein [Chitinophagales bacterium]